VFEVHKNGSIYSLILNLQKALRNPIVQKVVAVSDRKCLEKIKGEVEGLSDDFKRHLLYWDVSEVIRVYENLSEAMAIVERFGLISSELCYLTVFLVVFNKSIPYDL